MSTAVQPLKERRRNHWRWSAYLTGALALLLLSFAGLEEGKSGSYAVGYVLGRAVIVLLIALALRALYVKLVRRDDRPIWSPWVFAIAVPIALVLAAASASSS
jgi:uncharacterized membrane protein YhaH (DUF805 family)